MCQRRTSFSERVGWQQVIHYLNDTVSESDNMPSNGRIISQHSIEKDLKEAVVD
jgi:hypothetical protein